jgi:ligand-binding sensor domain-containing protein
VWSVNAGIFTTIASVSPAAAQVAVRIPDRNLMVTDIQNINGQVWLGTVQGLYRIDGDTAKLIGKPNLMVTDIQNINSQVWLGTDQGLYRVDGNTPKPIGDSKLDVRKIWNINGQVWLMTLDFLQKSLKLTQFLADEAHSCTIQL